MDCVYYVAFERAFDHNGMIFNLLRIVIFL